jgi:hypothetical protein
MRIVELVILIYCAYLAALAAVRPLAPSRRTRAWLLLATMAVTVLCSVLAAPSSAAVRVVRDWVPAVSILLGYWASGAFFISPMTLWERRLDAIDRRLSQYVPRLAAFDGVLELAYLSVYLVIPAGFAVVYFGNGAVDVDRYWTIVVLSEFGCYAMLPWIQTRPPRTLPSAVPAPTATQLHRLNLAVLNHGSIQANTFPSAHAAGAMGTALAVVASHPAAGMFFFVWAVLIAAGSVAGRYHYAADAILGVAWAAVVWSVVAG